jgi:Uma2 family endonuclease
MKTMGLPARKLEERYSYGDYKSWPNDERWELIDGAAWCMSPAPGRRHQEIAGDLYHFIRTYLEGKTCRVFIAPFDVLLPDRPDQPDDEVASVVQPDVLVYCDRSKLTIKGATGAPDLAVEIITPWTHKKDLNEKLFLYERHGVREFWIVDPGNRSILFFSLNANRCFGDPAVLVAPGRLESTILPGLVIDLTTLFSLE